MIEGKLSGISQLKQDIKILKIPKDKKKRILHNAMKESRKASIKHKNRQQNPDGTPYPKRKKPLFYTTKSGKEKERKLLAKIQRKSRIRSNAEESVWEYQNSISGRIAAEHQYGAELPIKGKDQQKEQQQEQKESGTKNGISREKAELLLKLGFKEPITPPKNKKEGGQISRRDVMNVWAKRILDGKNRRPSSVAYIQNNLTDGQVGSLIRILKKEQGIQSRTGKLVLPRRSHQDMDADRNSDRLTAEIDKEITNKL